MIYPEPELPVKPDRPLQRPIRREAQGIVVFVEDTQQGGHEPSAKTTSTRLGQQVETEATSARSARRPGKCYRSRAFALVQQPKTGLIPLVLWQAERRIVVRCPGQPVGTSRFIDGARIRLITQAMFGQRRKLEVDERLLFVIVEAHGHEK